MTLTSKVPSSTFALIPRTTLPILLGLLCLGACSTSQKRAPHPTGPMEMADSSAAVGPEPAASSVAQTPSASKEKKAAVAPMRGEAEPGASPPTEAALAGDDGHPDHHTEAYDHIVENRFVSVDTAPLSTFSIDVDTASYSNMRRFLAQGSLPPADAVRIEELVNYFDYDYDDPRDGRPIAVHTELAPAPWAPSHQLLHIGMQGKRMDARELPPRNLTFLVDVSGSMSDENKLPLLKRSFRALLETLDAEDTVSMVVYAGASGAVLEPTPANRQRTILEALERLEAGGSTNGGDGIELAYRLSQQHFQEQGVNRVILATDGDFNVGTTSQGELVRLIEKKREAGVFLTVLGFGMGNYKDSTLEQLADKGNGNYAYIDTFQEARKVLVEEGGASLVTIAKDVKIQVEMNPRYVGAYRLIGYENRALRAEDFNDDEKDAGEIGAGHTVTALYEILTPEQAHAELSVDALRYSRPAPAAGSDRNGEIALVKVRYKAPQGRRSELVGFAVMPRAIDSRRKSSDAFRFSAAVASFGMLLRHSEHAGASSFDLVMDLAEGALGSDRGGYKQEFLGLVEQARTL
jgi:Ca-activated chloride channel family protein